MLQLDESLQKFEDENCGLAAKMLVCFSPSFLRLSILLVPSYANQQDSTFKKHGKLKDNM
jgi:hypothetical protein